MRPTVGSQPSRSRSSDEATFKQPKQPLSGPLKRHDADRVLFITLCAILTAGSSTFGTVKAEADARSAAKTASFMLMRMGGASTRAEKGL